MIENNQKEDLEAEKDNQNNKDSSKVDKEISINDKLAETEDKLLRSLAEIENQRRRFEKEIKDAFEFGSFNFAKEILSILDNLQRAKAAIEKDEVLKNKDLNKFIENINIIQKDLIAIFEKNRIKKIQTKSKFNPNLHQAISEIEDDAVEQGQLFKKFKQDICLVIDF